MPTVLVSFPVTFMWSGPWLRVETLEDRPRYIKTLCFETFPFPDPTPELKERIRDLGERLDGHRKKRQALHPDVTLTGMYNVLEALRSGRELTAKERDIHEKGLVAILRQLHDETGRRRGPRPTAGLRTCPRRTSWPGW